MLSNDLQFAPRLVIQVAGGQQRCGPLFGFCTDNTSWWNCRHHERLAIRSTFHLRIAGGVSLAPERINVGRLVGLYP